MKSEDPSKIEDLLAACLEGAPGTWRERLEAACLEHPEQADELRKRFAGLEQAGVAEVSGVSGVSGADPESGSEGEAFGDYRLIGRIGAGAMGVVHAAWWMPEARMVALKILRPGQLGNEGARRRFEREMELSSSLDHPALIEVLDMGEHQGTPYLAMKLLEGETVAERILRVDGFPEKVEEVADVVRRFAALARGLEKAHGAGLVHRDIKPSNLMFTPDGGAVLLDFGLANRPDSNSGILTDPATRLGTPAYMAPEVIEGSPPEVRADIYSLGASLYESLTSRRAFEAQSMAATLRRATTEPPPDPRRSNPAVSRDLSRVVRTALARRPGERYASAALLAQDLEAVLEARPIQARRPNPLVSTWRWAREIPPVTLGLVVIAAALLAMLRQAQLTGSLREDALQGSLVSAVELHGRQNDTESRTILHEVLSRSHREDLMSMNDEPWAHAGGKGELLVGVGDEVRIYSGLNEGPEALLENSIDDAGLELKGWKRPRLIRNEEYLLVHESGEEAGQLAIFHEGAPWEPRKASGEAEALSEADALSEALAARLVKGDPTWLAKGKSDGELVVWRLDEDQVLEGSAGVDWSGVAITETGSILAWTSTGVIQGWSEAGQELAPARASGTLPLGAKASVQGGWLVTGSASPDRGSEDIPQLWKQEAEKTVLRGSIGDTYARQVEFTEDGRHLLILDSNWRLQGWQLPQGPQDEPEMLWQIDHRVGSYMHVSNGLVAVRPRSAELEVYRCADGAPVGSCRIIGSYEDLFLTASPPKIVLRTNEGIRVHGLLPSEHHLFLGAEIDTGLVGAWPHDIEEQPGILMMSTNGHLEWSGLDGERRTLWRLKPASTVIGAAYDPEEGVVAFATENGTVQPINADGTRTIKADGTPLKPVSLGGGLGGAWEIERLPGSFIFCGNRDSSSVHELPHVPSDAGLELPELSMSPRAIDFFEDEQGGRLALGGVEGNEGSVQLFDISATSCEEIDLAQGADLDGARFKSQVTTVALGSRWMLAASGDPSFRLFDLRNDPATSRDVPTQSPVYCADLSEDGRFAAVGCVDGSIEVHDLASDEPELYVTLRRHDLAVREVAFLVDGEGEPWLLSVSEDGTARRWPLGNNLEDVANEVLGRKR